MTPTPAVVTTTHYWHPHTGGVETVAAAHADELVRRGWRVEAHTSWSDRAAPQSERRERFQLHRHRSLNPLEQRLRVPVPFLLPGAGAELRRAASRADVVVSHGHVYPITVSAARAAASAGRPFVLVQHNPWVDYPAPIAMAERMADRTIGRRVIERSAVVVCVSQHTESYVRSMSSHARTVVVPNGVDTTRFVPGRRCDDGIVRFVCVRRLVPRNGVDLLLAAWRLLAARQRVELVVAGDGPERPALQRSAEDDPTVRFVGRVSDIELVRLLQTADASIVPTRSGEGFGLVAAESHSCGTPVIATDQGALREVVHHDVDGLLVPCNDATALAGSIARLVSDRALRHRLQRGALATDWSWSRAGRELDQVLRDVVSSRRSPR